MKKEIFVDDWEERLELQFFSDNPVRKKAYVCSPLSADAEQDYLFNMYAARAYMLYALMELDYLARAPHGYLPIILCDRNSDERTLALQFGLKLMEYSDVVLVCGNKLSRGMIGEIVQAVALNKKIIVFDEALCHEVRKIVLGNNGRRSLVSLDLSHPAMAHPRPQCAY